MTGWIRVLTWSVIGLVVTAVIVMLVVIRGIDPILTSLSIALIVGVVLARRGRRAGPIVTGVFALLFFGLGVPFLVLSLQVPESTLEFIVNSILLVTLVTIMISSVALIRRQRPESSRAPQAVGVVALGLVLIAIAYSTVVRLTANEAEARPGDLTLAAENTHFSKRQLDADDQSVSLVIHNKDFSGHTFTIDKLDVDEPLPGGFSTRVSFEAPSGSYHYYCSVPGHEQLMQGTLTVP